MKRHRSVGWSVWSAIALAAVAGLLGLLAPAGARTLDAIPVARQTAPSGERAAHLPGAGRTGEQCVRVARSRQHRRRSEPGTRDTAGIPQDARQVLAHIRDCGRAPEGYVGGRRFQNRERRLPSGREYREFDIHPRVRGRNRGPERLVIEWPGGKPGAAWYTPDHYRTFLPIGRDGR